MAEPLPPQDQPLLDLLRRLDEAGYDFVTPTPATHARVLDRRAGESARDLRDILGWSLPFDPAAAPPWLAPALSHADLLAQAPSGRAKAKVRASRVHGRLFLHSAYPAKGEDAVFLGPDSYRFADLIAAELPRGAPPASIYDVGGGAGVGAITAAALAPRARVGLSDVNPQALRLARVNAAHAGVRLDLHEASGLAKAPSGLDLILANPPYIAATDQAYSDGGGLHGGEISVEWAKAALERLSPGGRLILYTGSAIVAGRDRLREALLAVAEAGGAEFAYREIDPDVFGEELERPAYAEVERICVVACVLTR